MSSNNEDGKLEWMYRNSNEIVDREEYLLGRRLDKNVDSQSTSTAAESIPSSIFSLPESTNRVDAIRKIKEDPLEAIREKEREMRKELLKNPIQMKKLQKMIEAQQKKSKDSEQQKKKKSKKKKKKTKEKMNDSSNSDDAELDALLSKKLATLIKKYGKDKIFNSEEDTKDKKGKKKVLKTKGTNKSKADYSSSDETSSSSSSSSEDSDKNTYKRKKLKEKSKPEKKENNKETVRSSEKKSKLSRKRSYSSSESSSDESEEDRRSKLQKSRRKDEIGRGKEPKEHSYMKSERKGSSEDRNNGNKSFGLYVPKGARKATQDADKSKRSPKRNSSKDRSSKDRKRDRDNSKEKEKDRRRDRSIERRRDNQDSKTRHRNRSRSREREGGGRDRGSRRTGLTDEEKEKKLKEMMDNVSWRNDLIEKNSKRHKEQLKKEEGQLQDYDEHFSRKQLSKGIYSESVEKRIKSNIQNIQRSAFSMDKNFTKR